MKDGRVKSFFYLLLRDVVPFGVVEKILAELDQLRSEPTFSEEHMATYAETLMRRLMSPDPAPWKRDDIATLGVLSFTEAGANVPLSAIQEWSDEQCQIAEAWARDATDHSIESLDQQHPLPPHIAAWASWPCTHCQQRNTYWATACGRCGQPRHTAGDH